MGYTTDFEGSITVSPCLNQEEIKFLKDFSGSRRMKRTKGPYYIGSGYAGQEKDDDVLDYNYPPDGQPGLWCHWIASESGDKIEWDGGEKFYFSAEWMKYIIEHFLGPNPLAKQIHPEQFNFLQEHTLEGEIIAQGEENSDRWTLVVQKNVVMIRAEEPLKYDDE